MKEYTVDKIRNVGLVSHGSVGKTTLAEAVLFSAGMTSRIGSVDNGTTVTDYNQDEIDRKISIGSSLTHGDWKGVKFNIIDMPGYSDFIGEVKGGLRAVDSAVILLSALSGVEVGTEITYRIVDDYKLPRSFFVTKLDKEHSKFDNAVEMAKNQFGSSVVVLQFPVNEGEDFDSIVDLVSMKMLTFDKDGSGKYKATDIPEAHKAKAEELYSELMETISENDEALLDVFCEAGELTNEQIVSGLKEQVNNCTLFPLLCGSPVKNAGIHTFLDYVVDVLPSPADKPPVEGFKPGTTESITREPKADEPLCSLVFKTVSEQHIGELSFFRIFSGEIRSGMEVINPNKDESEKIGQIYLMNGKERNEIGKLSVGDIGAFVKLKNTHTGDTLCDKRNPIQLPEIEFPAPVIRVAVEPKAKGDEEKISTGMHTLHEEDPSFNIVVDGELKQIVASGQGELHLDIVVKRLKDKFGVEVNLVEPRIPYRETIRGSAEGSYKHKKQSGGRGQYGDVSIRLEPNDRGVGFEFVNEIVGGVIPSKFIPAVEKGIREVLEGGVIAGCPVVDVKATLYFGSFHSVDSSDMAFKIAGSMCFKNVFKESKPVLLEPIYDLEIQVPEDFMGDVMGDISSRRGKIQGMDAEGSFQLIKAKVPLAELYRYSTSLRSMTQGRGIHRRKFSHYEEVPKEVTEKIIAEFEGEKDK
ncbi:MAG: elongation factor G [candidate division KSB1 bacterium]|nr:elongation factor G [candidate division KSB1 bacterium]